MSEEAVVRFEIQGDGEAQAAAAKARDGLARTERASKDAARSAGLVARSLASGIEALGSIARELA